MSGTCGWRKDAKLFSVRKDVYGSLELVEGQVEDAIVTSGFSNRINSTGCVIVYKIYSVLSVRSFTLCYHQCWVFVSVAGHSWR